MDVAYLGVLRVDQQSDLNVRVSQLEDFHSQALTDLSILADQGFDVTAVKSELDAIAQQIEVLRADIFTMKGDGPDLVGWQQRADKLEARLRAVLARTTTDRSRAGELSQLQGLGWALLIGGVSLVAGVFVWAHRRRKK